MHVSVVLDASGIGRVAVKDAVESWRNTRNASADRRERVDWREDVDNLRALALGMWRGTSQAMRRAGDRRVLGSAVEARRPGRSCR